jgi:glycosyltransferase involved in cell wall biosynthesis
VKIIVIGTACWTFEKFRGSLLKKLVLNGHKVIAIGTNKNQTSLSFLESIGVKFYEVKFDEGRTNFISLLFSFHKILKIFNDYKPDICLAFFLKPIIIATFVKCICSFKLTSLVEGLGHTFTCKSPFLIRKIAKCFLTFTLKLSDKVIFLNNKDKEELFTKQGLEYAGKIFVLSGIGVDLNYYKFSPIRQTKINFLFLSRLLVVKGLGDFLEAASHMKAHNCDATFSVFGHEDNSVLGVNTEVLKRLHYDGIIYYGGLVHDVRDVIKSAHVLVLPTFYREGLPRCIQEAMSIGRPVITTDFSGCSDIIEEKINGWIVPAHDVFSLVRAMEWYCSNRAIFPNITTQCRITAEKYFNSDNSDRFLLKTMLS